MSDAPSAGSPVRSPVPIQAATQADGRLPNGAVAGIVVGAAVAVALITFLITFFALRRKWTSPSRRLHKKRLRSRSRASGNETGFGDGWTRQHKQDAQNGESMSLDVVKDLTSYEVHLPQPADDHALRKRTAIVFDQIELHVENFYRKSAANPVNLTEASIGRFNSLDTGKLSTSLSSLVHHARNVLPIAKHTLAYLATSSISSSMEPRWSLLPYDLTLIPRAVASSDARGKSRQVAERCLPRWRVLTAYLRPDPSQDATYIDARDATIEEMVRTFSIAFSSWKNAKYSDEQRIQSLSAVLKETADLGIWLSAQPSELRFRWPAKDEVSPREVAVAPGLTKVTDEHGKPLPEPIALIRMSVQGF